MRFLGSNATEMRWRPGLCPGPHLGSLQRSPRLSARFQKPLRGGKGTGGEARRYGGRKGKVRRKGEERKRGEGRGL